MVKAILLVCDGLGDRPIKELGDKTPLEAAYTPNLDKLAAGGITGLMNTLDYGLRPGSDTSHLALLGYDPREYYHGRGPFEAAGIGMQLKAGDVAFRANAGTVDDNLIVVDRRAGRIADTSPIADALNGTVVDGITFLLKPGTGHRLGVVMRGPGISSKISDPDPHELNVKVHEAKPLDDSKEAKFTAQVVNHFIEKAHGIMKSLPINEQRAREGNPVANFLMMRGAGYIADTPSFRKNFGLKAACVAGAGLYKGVGRMLGMDIIEVDGATGLPDTDVAAKFRAARKALDDGYDFVFVHVKAADSLGEDGNFEGKKSFIEKIDDAAVELAGLEDTLVVVAADHSTPCELSAHSGDPVPVLMNGPGIRVDHVKQYGERACMTGGLGRMRGLQLMPEIINILGLARLVGA